MLVTIRLAKAVDRIDNKLRANMAIVTSQLYLIVKN